MYRISLKDLPELAFKAADKELLESFYFRCKIKNLTDASLKNLADRILYLMRYADSIGKGLVDLTEKDIQDYLLTVIKKNAPITVNGRVAAYKVLYNHLYQEGLLESDPSKKLKKIREPQIVKPVISPEELGKILSSIKRKDFYSHRNFCMILLTYDGMVRVSELVGIKVENVDLDSRLVRVKGKGNKQRFAPISIKTAKAVHTFMVKFQKKLNSPWLFPRIDGDKLNFRRAHRIFRKAGDRVGIHLAPHLCRHSGASQFIRSGGNVAILQKILGHSSLAITQRYVHLSTDDMVNAYENFSPTANLKF